MTIKNAIVPGAMRKNVVFMICPALSKNLLERISNQPSTIRLIEASVAPIIGANQYIVAAGLFTPTFSSFNSICVKLQRNPPRALPDMTKMNPPGSNRVSDATIMSTPATISHAANRHLPNDGCTHSFGASSSARSGV